MSAASSITGTLHTAMRNAATDYLEAGTNSTDKSKDWTEALTIARDLLITSTLAYVTAWETVYMGQEPLRR